jgi:hypothetical protein
MYSRFWQFIISILCRCRRRVSRSRISYSISGMPGVIQACARSVTRIRHPLLRTMASVHSPDAYLVPFDSNTESSATPFKPSHLWSTARPKNKAEEVKIFYDVDQKGSVAALVSVGTSTEALARKEAIRRAAGIGAKKLRESGAKVIAVDSTLDAHAAGLCPEHVQRHSKFLNTSSFPVLSSRRQRLAPRLDSSSSR